MTPKPKSVKASAAGKKPKGRDSCRVKEVKAWALSKNGTVWFGRLTNSPFIFRTRKELYKYCGAKLPCVRVTISVSVKQ